MPVHPPRPGSRLLTPAVGAPAVLAHASGFSWDEALLVAAPLVVIAGLLWLANRRAGRLAEQPGDGENPDAASPTEGTTAADPAGEHAP